MDEQQLAVQKEKIDGMTHEEMGRLWRFAPSGHPFFDKTIPLFDYFNARFQELGGWTPELSKAIGH